MKETEPNRASLRPFASEVPDESRNVSSATVAGTPLGFRETSNTIKVMFARDQERQ